MLQNLFTCCKSSRISQWPINVVMIQKSNEPTLTNMIRIFTTLKPIQNGRHLAYDIFKCIFLKENV